MSQASKKRASSGVRKKAAARKAPAPKAAGGRGASAGAKGAAKGKVSASRGTRGGRAVGATRGTPASGRLRAVRANGAGTVQSSPGGLATRRRVDPAALEQMGRLLREMGAIVCFFAALIALIALASFHIDDPGWSHTGAGAEVSNSVGRAGAWFADVTLYLFGFMAYLIPLVLGVAGFLLLRGGGVSVPGTYRPFVFVRVIGVALMLASASGLADLHLGVPDDALPRGTYGGGILGTEIAWRLVAFLHHLGTTLFLLALFFCSLTLAFGTSWIQLVETLGGAVVRVFDGLRHGARERSARAAEVRAERERVFAADAVRREREALGQEEMDLALDGTLRDAHADRDGLDAHSRAGGGGGASGGGIGALFAGLGRALGVGSGDAARGRGDARGGRRLVTASGMRFDERAAPPLDEVDALLDGSASRERQGAGGGRGGGSGAGKGGQAGIPVLSGTSAGADAASGTDAVAGAAAKKGKGRRKAASGEAVDTGAGDGSPEADESGAPNATGAFPAKPLRIERAVPELPVVAATPVADVKKPKKKAADAEAATGGGSRMSASLFVDVPDTDLPPISLLDAPEPQRPGFSDAELEALSRLLEEKLAEFRITVQVVAVHPGPVITRFEMQLAPGIKASRVTGLAQDIARSMSLVSVRVVEVIAGKSTIGIEVPNEHRETVQLSEMLRSQKYVEKKSPLTLALGKDISGHSVTADLGRMPHLLVAGTTGSGKSVAVNSMLISLLYKATAKDVRLILIDPKMLELNVYDGIPHLLAPVVTDMKEAANALRWCVGEMERRYMVMAELKVRGITGYNKKIRDAAAAGTPIVDPLYRPELALDPSGPPPTLEPMPFIVVVVDEFADMMMQVGKKAEELIARIAQKARAAGIHLILATQRPSVDVITGLIKANVPTRIAFQVSSKIDSRTIIDQGGAESLLGHGDMLYQPPGSALTQRVHGAFVDDHEVVAVVQHIKRTGEPNYIEEILQENTVMIPGISGGEPGEGEDVEADALYDQAVAVVLESRKASISYVQRRLKIGYNRAARMIEQMEESGVISAVGGSGMREVLAPPPQQD